MLSTSPFHIDNKFYRNTDELKKPKGTFHVILKRMVSTVDEHMAFHNDSSKFSRWTTVTFYALMNITGFNLFLMFIKKKIRNRTKNGKFLTNSLYSD